MSHNSTKMEAANTTAVASSWPKGLVKLLGCLRYLEEQARLVSGGRVYNWMSVHHDVYIIAILLVRSHFSCSFALTIARKE